MVQYVGAAPTYSVWKTDSLAVGIILRNWSIVRVTLPLKVAWKATTSFFCQLCKLVAVAGIKPVLRLMRTPCIITLPRNKWKQRSESRWRRQAYEAHLNTHSHCINGSRSWNCTNGVQLMRLNWILILPAINWSLLPDFSLASLPKQVVS